MSWLRKVIGLFKWMVAPVKYDHLSPADNVARRKKNTRFVIIGFTALFVLLTIFAILLRDSSVDTPISNDIAVALVLNLNVILLVVMVLLVFRNLIKLYMERRWKIAGSKFQTKLVILFLAMTLVPAALMFTVASELIGDTVDKWLNTKIEKTLHESLQVAESLYSDAENATTANAEYMASLLDMRGLMNETSLKNLNRLLRQKLREYNVEMIQIYDGNFQLAAEALKPGSEASFSLGEKTELLAKLALGEKVTAVDDKVGRNMIISMAPVPDELSPAQVKGVVLVGKEVSRGLLDRAQSISNAFEDYKQLKIKKEIIKISYQMTLALVALVIIFSSIWIGFYLARGITVPLKALSEAAEAVAGGNLDVRIDAKVKNDEVGQLIDSFNKMTKDLKGSKAQLEEANRNLVQSNIELHHRGEYIEAVLENVGGGVVSIDKGGSVTTINAYAASMFGVSPDKALGKPYRKVFDESLHEPVRRMIRNMGQTGGRTLESELEASLNGARKTLKLSISMLKDQDGRYIGAVIVFDDLTHLIAAQRAMAWREMARIVAHEIKNPLTPIQLNAQRLRRKFQQKAEDFPKVFDDATNSIIQEVDELKRLVEKFSAMAKMTDAAGPSPRKADMKVFELRPEPAMLNDIILDVVKLYRDTRPGVAVKTELDPSIQLVRMDPEQMRRVFINLVENAMDAINGEGAVKILTRMNVAGERVMVEVSDTGRGIDGDNLEKIFTPYYSTKPKGAGLGLAIASRVVEDHGGTIKASPNKPSGAVFTIELPNEG
ncbi:MAG: HAMP domain-containing protein [Nitrospinae bacterium]|nr:HAMP domain-containing protein [Nitrospinota bacterium]